MAEFTDSKTDKVAQLIRETFSGPIERLLVVGCGNGIEAAILARSLRCKVVGVDVEKAFDADAERAVKLQVGDAMHLDLDNEGFDFVYSYHALEHIADPVKALGEMRRVLKRGGGFWIGTPNRSRIVGYIGSKEGTLSDKLRWNLADWKMRLAGKFRNEHGAHAGFSRKELRDMLTGTFGNVRDATDDYFAAIYPRQRRLLKAICWSGVSDRVYPSVYFTGRK